MKAADLLIDNTVHVCRERFGPALRAIVLTGSLAREEETWARDGSRLRLLGDADIFLVFHGGARIPPDDASGAQEAIEQALAESGITAHICLAPVHPQFFARMPRHIATYELRVCGRVAWGDSGILSLVPGFRAEEISREDAWRMLANRIIEQLETAAADGIGLSARSRYATVKLFLDMATSYLIFSALYRPTYQQRMRELENLARHPAAEAPFPLAPFADYVRAATVFKVQGTPLPYTPEHLYAEAARYAAGLWAWQLAQLTGSRSGSGADELMKCWMRQVPTRTRLRSWASAARRSRLNPRLCLRWLRLMGKGSPRHLTYRAAAELYFRLTEPQDSNAIAELAGSLPLVLHEAGASTWQDLAQEIAANYHQLLESTTA